MTDTRDKLAAELMAAAIHEDTTWPDVADALLASDVLRDMLNEARREGAEAAWPEVRGWINEAEARGRAEVAAAVEATVSEWEAADRHAQEATNLPPEFAVVSAVLTDIRNALADRGALDRVRAEAWDEGYETCTADTEARSAPPGPNGPIDPSRNPYRADRIERDGGA